jgi:transcriptional regulator with XRE-family HTH domain
MTQTQYLDAVRRHLHLPSDYALAKRLGLSTQAVSQYRTEQATFDNRAALKVAMALGIDPFVVVVDMEILRAKTPELGVYWLAKKRELFGQKDRVFAGV